MMPVIPSRRAWPHIPPNELTTVIYNRRFPEHDDVAFGETYMPSASQSAEPNKIMGDRSPKSNQKKSSQKQSQASSAAEKNKAAVLTKQAAGKKR